ncbi:MAG TPA: DUF1501 domain-containing protein [Pirellulales bacterium]|nr:DUF1501 domain-containing protein [Pirellulales bacterium]
MLAFHDRPLQLCDGINRREWLRLGGLGAFGLSLPALWQARRSVAAPLAIEGNPHKAKSCIVLFLMGGPPQHETWDPKPDAPQEIRGELKPIDTRTPGLMVGELMPRTATLTDKIAVIRSLATNDNAHSSSGYWMLTGTPHLPTNSENSTPGAPNDWPSLGAVVKHLRSRDAGLPATVVLPEHIWNTGGIPWPGQNAGWLGRKADPWLLNCDPSAADFQVPGLTLPGEVSPERFASRQSLLDSLARHLDAAQGAGGGRYDLQRRQAIELLASPPARQAFELSREPAEVRERYGMNRFGQSVLLARRMVEAGVSLVQVNWTRFKEDTALNPAWDTHAANAARLKSPLMPVMDLAYSALLEDLAERGLLDETLVVWMGEFGRSPKINPSGGRDHWGYVFSAALAGGGIRGGQVYGASDSIGAYPKDNRVGAHDFAATIFHCLGISAGTELTDQLGRPLVVSRGEVLRALL